MNIFFSLKTNDKHLFDANANIGCLGEVTQCSMSEVISQKPSKIRLNLLLSTNKKDQLSGLKVKVKVSTLDIAPLLGTPPQKRSGTDHTVLPANFTVPASTS